MANPQLENGYMCLANELAEALMRINLSAYQSRVLWAIWRRTYGWKKKGDWVPNSLIVKMTGLDKRHVCRAKKELIARNIIIANGRNLAFQKDYEKWRQTPKVIPICKKIRKSENKKLSIKMTNTNPAQVEELKRKTNVLSTQGEFPAVYSWVQKVINEKKHLGAILLALERCIETRPNNPWGFCDYIVKVESGNFHERDQIQKHMAEKESLGKTIKGLFGESSNAAYI